MGTNDKKADALCSCPEPGCAFRGAPLVLISHLAVAHLAIQGAPIFAVRYGLPSKLTLPLSQAWHAVVGMRDSSLFLISLAAHVHFTAVSLVCVRPDAGPRPLYRCRLTVESPDGDTYAQMTSMVSPSTLPGGLPVPGDGTPFLGLTRDLIPSGGTLVISVLIDQLQTAPAA